MTGAQGGPSDRIHYVDWLRCGAVLAVVVFHALLPFGSIQPWVIQNAERSDALARGFGLAATLLVVAAAVRVAAIRPLLGLRRRQTGSRLERAGSGTLA